MRALRPTALFAVGEGVLSGRTLAPAEPLTTLPRSARSRVSLVAPLQRPPRTPSPPCIDSQPHVPSARERSPFRRNHRGVVATGRLDRALLRGVVDMDDAESLGVAERPLVIVKQRPREVSAQIDALRHRVVRGAQVLSQVLDSQRVFDSTIDGA